MGVTARYDFLARFAEMDRCVRCDREVFPGAPGANIHIDDGKVCYAASIGRRSEFTDEELETYRKIKRRLK